MRKKSAPGWAPFNEAKLFIRSADSRENLGLHMWSRLRWRS